MRLGTPAPSPPTPDPAATQPGLTLPLSHPVSWLFPTWALLPAHGLGQEILSPHLKDTQLQGRPRPEVTCEVCGYNM